MKKRRLICISILLCFLNPATAQQLTVIALKNRHADGIISTIKPLLKGGEGVSGHGYEIYLNAGPDTTQDIQALVAHLDRQAAQLLISVRNADTVADNHTGYSVSGSLGNDHVRIATGDKTDHDGISLQASNRIISTSEHNIPQIRVTEGQPALIYAGTSVPVRTVNRQRNNGHIIEREVVDYHPVQNGYYVTTWLSNDIVRLELKQQNDSIQSTGTINVSGVATSVQGRLGEWISVGGLDSAQFNASYDTGAGSAVSTQAHKPIYIKVERLD